MGEPLRILVYPHAAEVGGSQLNAVELAAAVRDLDHEVTVISDAGPLVDRVRELGLPHLPLPEPRRRPSPAVALRLRRLIHDLRLDIIHGYEWPPALEAAAAVFPAQRASAVCTVMSMAVAPFLPPSMPLVVGTRALQRLSSARRSGPVYLIEPPVDVVANGPGHPVAEFRARYGLGELAGGVPAVEVVVVCRLVPELKLEGVLTAVDVVGELAREYPVRLTVVGDGAARPTVEEHATVANARAGRRAVVLTGELLDPRPAYASADIMLGMGGSALRALAFARPLVVQGEHGFWRLLTPESCPLFLEQGWYGVGDGTGGHERLASILVDLIPSADARATLGEYGRRLAVERFSLQNAAAVQEHIYREARDRAAVARRIGTAAVEGVRATSGVIVHKGRQRYRRRRGNAARDDFNAVTLAAAPLRAEHR